MKSLEEEELKVSLAQYLKIPSDKMQLYQRAAWFLIDEGSFEQAAAVFRGLIELEPTNLESYRGYIIVLCHEQDIDTLKKVLERVFILIDGKEEFFGLYLQALSLFSSLLYMSDEKDEAMRIADYVIENTKDDESLDNEAWLKTFKKDVLKAKKILKLVPAKRKSLGDELVFNELILEALQKIEEERAYWAEALAYSEADLMEMFDIASVYLAGGDAFKALTIFDALILLDPDVPLFVFACAEASCAAEEFEKAKKRYAQSVHMARQINDFDAFKADALYGRALLALRTEDLPLAQKSLREILRINKSYLSDTFLKKVEVLSRSVASF